MLHFLKKNRKGSTPPRPVAPARSISSEARGKVSSSDAPDTAEMPSPKLAVDMLYALIRCLARTGQFQGAFEPYSEFESDMTPETIETIRHRSCLASGLIDQDFLTLSFAGITGPHLAKLGVDVVMETLFEISPRWREGRAGATSTRLPFGPPKHWMTIDCFSQAVDPWDSGQNTDGAIMRIALTKEV